MESKGVQLTMNPETPALETVPTPAVDLPVAAPQSTLPSTEMTAGSWGAEEITASDILLPKILLMQGLSKAVAAEKAKIGDMIDSLTTQVIGSKEKGVEIVAFQTYKTWIISQQLPGETKMKYVRQEPMTAANENWPMEEVMNGVKVQRDRAINVYCLVPGQEESFPYLISFRRTSYNAGRKLVTHFTKLKMFGLPPAARVYELTCTKQENDKGIFYVFDVSEKRKSTEAEMKKAWDWFQVVKSTKVRVDDSDLEDETSNGTAAPVDPSKAATRQF